MSDGSEILQESWCCHYSRGAKSFLLLTPGFSPVKKDRANQRTVSTVSRYKLQFNPFIISHVGVLG